MIKVSLTDKQAQLLLNVYRKQEKEIEQKMSDLQIELKDIRAGITELTGATKRDWFTSKPLSVEFLIDGINEYDSTWSYSKKIEYALKKIGRGATTKDIVQFILEHEPTRARKQLVSSVSAVLSMEKDKKFSRITNKNEEYEYSLI